MGKDAKLMGRFIKKRCQGPFARLIKEQRKTLQSHMVELTAEDCRSLLLNPVIIELPMTATFTVMEFNKKAHKRHLQLARKTKRKGRKLTDYQIELLAQA